MGPKRNPGVHPENVLFFEGREQGVGVFLRHPVSCWLTECVPVHKKTLRMTLKGLKSHFPEF